MEWVMQTGAPGRNGGCGIACLAMLTQESYNKVRELAPDLCEKCGVEVEPMDHYLAEQGFAIRRLHEYKEFDGKAAERWPPKPFAEQHLCLVLQTRKDHVAHYVCMNDKGLVFDPADIEYTKCRLSRYYRVFWVAGIYQQD